MDKEANRVLQILGAALAFALFMAIFAPATHAGIIQDKVDAAADGATVTIEDGVYDERVVIRRPVMLVTRNLHGAEVTGGISIQSDNVLVQGFHVRDVTEHIVAVGGNERGPHVSNVIIADLLIERVQRGLMIWGDEWLVDNVEIRDLRRYKNDDADYARAFGQGITIQGCYFHGTDPANIGSAHVDAIQSYTNHGYFLLDATISDCTFEAFHQGVFLEDSTTDGSSIQNVTIRNCIFRNGLTTGFPQGVVFKGATDCNAIGNLFAGLHVGVRTSLHGTGFANLNIFENVKNPAGGAGLTIGENYTTLDAVPIPLMDGHPATGYGPASIQPGGVAPEPEPPVEPEPDVDPLWGPTPFVINGWRLWGVKEVQ